MIRALLIILVIYTLIGGMVDLLTIYQGKKFIFDMQGCVNRFVLIFILIYLL